MIKPSEIKKGLQNELLGIIIKLGIILEVVLIVFFLQDKRFTFEEIICLLVILLIITFIETRTNKIGYFKNIKNMKFVFSEFTKYLTEDNIVYKDKEEIANKVEELLKTYPTNRKYKLEFLINLYIRELFTKLLIKVQNDEIECVRVKELADDYEEYLDESYMENLKDSNEFFIAKKHNFQKNIQTPDNLEKLENENFVFMQKNIGIQRLSKIITKNGCIYYSNKRIIFVNEDQNLITDLSIKNITNKTMQGMVKDAYIFTLKDEFIINMNDVIKRKQMNEIIDYFKDK